MKRITGLIVVGAVLLGSSFLLPTAPVGAAANTSPGTVISSASQTINSTLSKVSTSKRITYYSTDSGGHPIVVSGLVLRPKNAPATNGKVVAWAHGTAGIADRCAPSTSNNLGFTEYTNEVASYLSKGWTVAATDYPGLGTPGVHPYGNGDMAARSVIDSVRAARTMYNLSTDWVVSGHSQGSQAALFTGQIADTYGVGLNLKGVVAMGAAYGTDSLAKGILQEPSRGYVAFAIFGMAAYDSTIVPQNILTPAGYSRADLVLNTGCISDVLNSYSTLTPEQMLPGGVIPQNVLDVLKLQDSAREQSAAPVSIAVGTNDSHIPADNADELLNQECARGSVATLTFYDGVSHLGVVPAANSNTLKYISDRFAGVPAPNSCRV